MHGNQDALVLDRRWVLRQRPLSGDVGTHRVQAPDQTEISVLLQPHAGGQSQVAAAAFAGDDDARRIDAEAICVGMHPLQARNTVVQAGGKRSHFRRGRGVYRIAEINHCHRDAARGDHPTPGLVVALVAGTHLYAATVDVIHARDSLVVVWPEVLNLDRVPVRRRGEDLSANCQAGRRGDVFAVHGVEHGPDMFHGCLGLAGILLRQQLLPARHIRLRSPHVQAGEVRLNARIETGVEFKLRGHATSLWPSRCCRQWHPSPNFHSKRLE
jgi:hypothetical protein